MGAVSAGAMHFLRANPGFILFLQDRSGTRFWKTRRFFFGTFPASRERSFTALGRATWFRFTSVLGGYDEPSLQKRRKRTHVPSCSTARLGKPFIQPATQPPPPLSRTQPRLLYLL